MFLERILTLSSILPDYSCNVLFTFVWDYRSKIEKNLKFYYSHLFLFFLFILSLRKQIFLYRQFTHKKLICMRRVIIQCVTNKKLFFSISSGVNYKQVCASFFQNVKSKRGIIGISMGQVSEFLQTRIWEDRLVVGQKCCC